MKAKDRATVYIHSNTDVSNKIPIAIISSSKNLRCFKTQLPICMYMGIKKESSNGYLFQKWIIEVFKPNFECNQSNRVALIVDNASSHRKLTTHEGIDIFPLPPKVTSVHQLMYQGVIRTRKANHRRIYPRTILPDIETRITRRE